MGEHYEQNVTSVPHDQFCARNNIKEDRLKECVRCRKDSFRAFPMNGKNYSNFPFP